MLLHNGTDASDVKVFWQSPTCVKLSVRWPDFMIDARQLAGCLTQEDVFGKGKDPSENGNHPLDVESGKHPAEQIKNGSREFH